jgi:hypothetical protein
MSSIQLRLLLFEDNPLDARLIIETLNEVLDSSYVTTSVSRLNEDSNCSKKTPSMPFCWVCFIIKAGTKTLMRRTLNLKFLMLMVFTSMKRINQYFQLITLECPHMI